MPLQAGGRWARVGTVRRSETRCGRLCKLTRDRILELFGFFGGQKATYGLTENTSLRRWRYGPGAGGHESSLRYCFLDTFPDIPCEPEAIHATYILPQRQLRRRVADSTYPPTQAYAEMALISPTLTTPLLKIPLLLASTVYSYRGWTPPTPVADAKEQQRFSIPDWLSRNNRTQLPVSYVLKVS